MRLRPFSRTDVALAVGVLAGLFAVLALLPRHWLGGREREVAGAAFVIDGDTLDVRGQRVRLMGIDAPELHQTCGPPERLWPCGEVARDALRAQVERGSVRCAGRASDVYHRLIATCLVRDADLGEGMVRGGFAVAHGAYRAAEREAQESRRASGPAPSSGRSSGGPVMAGAMLKECIPELWMGLSAAGASRNALTLGRDGRILEQNRNAKMGATAEELRALRQEVAGLERWAGESVGRRVPLGHGDVDAALGGGLEAGRLHEIFAAAGGDAGAAAGFAAMLSVRLGRGVFWLRQEQAGRQGGALHGPGLAELGLDPARLVLGVLADPLAVLSAAGEAARCPGVGAVVVELHGMPRALDLTATRRLALAAETSGAGVLLLRFGAEERPSASWTRWRVTAAPSAALEAGAPGHPALTLELTRQKSGPPGGPWQVEWDRDGASFRTWGGGGAALSGASLPPAADRPPAPGGAAGGIRRIAG